MTLSSSSRKIWREGLTVIAIGQAGEHLVKFAC
jgi:aldehyde:ferredoxin oxidoreductase